jgi:hypothetical protein
MDHLAAGEVVRFQKTYPHFQMTLVEHWLNDTLSVFVG